MVRKMETKSKVRKRILAERDSLTEDKRHADSQTITQNILSLPAYREAEAVFCYVSYRSEVETDRLIRQALSDGKKVYCPRVILPAYDSESHNNTKAHRMEFYEITTMESLEKGYMGILEPKPLPENQFVISKQFCELTFTKIPAALFLMPGAAFDSAHHRIGYGGGFYDAYLARCQKAGIDQYMTTAALAFSSQITDTIEAEPHDITPCFVVTEQRIL